MEQTIKFWGFQPTLWFGLEDRNPNFLHDTPGYDDTVTPTHQI